MSPTPKVDILLPLGRELLERATAIDKAILELEAFDKDLEDDVDCICQATPDSVYASLKFTVLRLRWLARTYTSITES